MQPEGGVETENSNEFASGSKFVTLRQRYRFTAVGETTKKFHFLVVDVQYSIGSAHTLNPTNLVPINEGIGFYDCSHFYDDAKKADQSPPSCKFTPRAALTSSGTVNLKTIDQ